jgi:hypothetical protein
MLTCEKCGYDNELGRIFCHQCGSKLDLSRIKAPGQGGPSLRKKKARKKLNPVRLAVELAVIAAVLAGIWLLLGVPALPPTEYTAQDYVSAERKVQHLGEIVRQNRPDSVMLSEREINAYLGNLQLQHADSRGLRIEVSGFRARIDNGTITIIFSGDLRIGQSFKKPVSVTYTGVPTVSDGKFVLKPAGGAVGRMPIHPIIVENTRFIQRYYVRVFEDMTKEKDILNKMTSIAVRDRTVQLSYKPSK